MRFLLLPAAALLTATSTSAADDPKVIQPKLPSAVDILSSKAPASEPNLLRPRLSRVIDPIPEHCPDLPTIAARKRGRALSPEKLAELPPGEAYHAVYRRGPDGCIDPVLVGDDNTGDR